MEQVHVLEDHRDIGKEAVAGKLAQIVPADRDRALLRIIEAGEQAANRRLAGARGADDCGRGLLGDREGNVLENRSGIVAEGDVLKRDIIVCQRNVLAVRVDELVGLQRIQLVHRIVNHAQRMRAVADGLQACENAEREEQEEQARGKVHLAAQALQSRRERKPDRAALERQQMQRVPREVAPLDFEMNASAVFNRLCNRVHARAAFAEGLHNGQSTRVFNDSARQITVRLRLNGGVDAAVVRDKKQRQKRNRRRG